MIFIGIDPGPVSSAIVEYDSEMKMVISHAKISNHDINRWITASLIDHKRTDKYVRHVAIESIASYGMAVGKSVFETAEWCGIIATCFGKMMGAHRIRRVYRQDVKMKICGSMKAKDANIRAAIIDLFEPTGGGKIPQIGTKTLPGPLYGLTSDRWAALGVAITAASKWNELQLFPQPR